MSALLVSFVVLLAAGTPVVFVIGISMFAYFIWTGQHMFLLTVPQRMFAGGDSFVLLAIPLFILAGNLMEAGGLTHRLLRFAKMCVGRFTGGVSLTAVWGSMLFGGVSGSAAADAAALGSVLIPEMKREGYDVNYAAALMSMSSLMAPLIPPSIALVIFGALSQTSIARLFIAGIIPAFLLAIGLSIYAVWIAKKRNYPRSEPPTLREFISACWEVIPVMLLPIIIVGGIRGGVFTPTEAAAVAALYALIVAGLLYRTLTLARIRDALLNTALLTAAIFLLVAMANIASFIFAMEKLPQTVVAGLYSISENPIFVLIMVNIILLLLGTVLEATPTLILTVPALVGIGQAVGIDQVQLGVMVVFNILIGFITPPVGLCLFIVSNIARTRVDKVAWHALPMIGIALVVLMIITFVPAVTLWLPELLVK
ncbi:TRAP transporter large permease [Chelativorans sp. Marseille-P2723]|uniref:TRAP transporter large permease n=1 Tax=Chelativorans sp. Marseille-P2723 TaxID=2709133 RepID=UPI0015704A64|nr:TRAP transporter large permease [Chelativorans sp. Marseille-P2723]